MNSQWHMIMIAAPACANATTVYASCPWHAVYMCNPTSACKGNYTCKHGYADRMCYFCDSDHYRYVG